MQKEFCVTEVTPGRDAESEVRKSDSDSDSGFLGDSDSDSGSDSGQYLIKTTFPLIQRNIYRSLV